jgi:hypothetical protein
VNFPDGSSSPKATRQIRNIKGKTMKKLVLVFALLLTTSAAFAEGSGLPPWKSASTVVTTTNSSGSVRT